MGWGEALRRLGCMAAVAVLAAACGGGGTGEEAGVPATVAAATVAVPEPVPLRAAAPRGSRSASPAGKVRLLVRLKSDAADPLAHGRGHAQAHGGEIGHVYGRAARGYSVLLPLAAVDALMAALAQD